MMKVDRRLNIVLRRVVVIAGTCTVGYNRRSTVMRLDYSTTVN
jgi:hypothetical protein